MATIVMSSDGNFVAGSQNVPLKVASDVVLTLAQANTYTLPSAAQGGLVVGDTFSVTATNGAAFTATFAAASGETLVGTGTITTTPGRKTFVRTGALEWSIF